MRATLSRTRGQRPNEGVVDCREDVSPTVSVERRFVSRDVDGLLHPSLEPSILSIQDADVVLGQSVSFSLHVLAHGGRFSPVFFEAVFQVPFRLAHVGVVTVLTLDLVDCTGLVHGVGLVLGGY